MMLPIGLRIAAILIAALLVIAAPVQAQTLAITGAT
jgi:hypothetical protein